MQLFLIQAAATVLAAVYLILFLMSGSKYRQMMEAMDDPLRGLARVGFQVLDMIGFKGNSRSSEKALKNFRIVYGKKYGEFYYRANMAQRISLGSLTFIAGLLLAVILETPVLALIAAILAFSVVYYYHSLVSEKIRQRSESFSSEYPELLSKLALLINAGMIMTEAWEKIANTGSGILYEEMRITLGDIRNGMPAADAYLEFSYRCSNDDITKFISTLIQNMRKGNRELVEYLTQYSQEAWNQKKQRALQKGQAASSKLMIPIGMMFVGLLLMICVPIFAGIGF